MCTYTTIRYCLRNFFYSHGMCFVHSKTTHCNGSFRWWGNRELAALAKSMKKWRNVPEQIQGELWKTVLGKIQRASFKEMILKYEFQVWWQYIYIRNISKAYSWLSIKSFIYYMTHILSLARKHHYIIILSTYLHWWTTPL